MGNAANSLEQKCSEYGWQKKKGKKKEKNRRGGYVAAAGFSRPGDKVLEEFEKVALFDGLCSA